MSTISIIILNYNGFEETTKLVKSIIEWNHSELEYNVIVVDNCSNDGSYEKLSDTFFKIKHIDIIQSEKNGGYSYGNNFGAKFAIENYKPDYIAFANPDIEIKQKTVIELLETFKFDNKIGMCAPIMMAVDGSYSIHSCKLPTYLDDLCASPFGNKARTIITSGYNTLDEENKIIVTDILPGSFFIIRTDCFITIGMFDENVFLFCEERIIGRRMKEAGFLAVLRADLFFLHRQGATIKKTFSTIDTWKQILKSRYYYQEEYCKVGVLRLLLLKIAMQIYLILLLSLLKTYEILKK